ncbi:MAG TPA: glycine betaine ABC transporter substrate-binding protein [Thermomicrobiales bacterium]|nr:glycine betaine ABC transporter substrate-binding protein [Thermomicrobiales bacterium]
MKLRSMILLMLLALAIPLLAACGDDDDSDDDTAPTATTSSAATSPSGSASPTAGGDEASPTGATGGTGEGGPVVIGSKNFTEQLILGEMYAQLLEAAGIEVERSLNLGGTAVAHEALVAGEIHMYPEYTGTGLLTILEMETMSDPDEVFTVVSEAYAEQFDLVWLDQTPMNNTQALAVKREFSEENDLTTITQMAAMAGELRLAAVPDFPERPDGLVGLNDVYGDFEFQEIIILDPGLKYQALINDDAEVVVAFGTDGQIAGYDLVVLEDDQGLWPPYHVAPVIRQETLDAYPQIADILNELAPLLTSEVMADLNWQVDGDDAMEPEDVAREFLTENGLLDE